MQINIKHDEDNQKFFTDINGSTARLEYKLRGKDTIDFLSTFVPKEFRHHGIGKKLAEKGLNYAKENNLNVIPTCSFIDNFIEEHDEFKKLLTSF